MTDFYLIRHGATDAIGKSFTGRLPGVPLTSEGTTQASRLATRLGAESIQNIYSSPSTRALQTASHLGEALGLAVVEDPAFCEIDIGDWSGRLFTDLRGMTDFARFNSVRSLSRPPSGEIMLEVQARAVAQFLRLANRHPDSVLAIVTHSDVIKASLAYFLGIPIDLAHRLEIGLCGYSIVRLGPDSVQVVAINRHADL
jgi:probable phosphoglycerate mutase